MLTNTSNAPGFTSSSKSLCNMKTLVETLKYNPTYSNPHYPSVYSSQCISLSDIMPVSSASPTQAQNLMNVLTSIDSPKRHASEYLTLEEQLCKSSDSDLSKNYGNSILNFEPLVSLVSKQLSKSSTSVVDCQVPPPVIKSAPVIEECGTYSKSKYSKKSQKPRKSFLDGITLEKIMDQKHCLNYQNAFTKASYEELDNVISKIETNITQLVFHKYGNYFIRSLIANSKFEGRIKILNKMEPIFLKACYDLFGIHPVQAFLSLNITAQEELIIRSIVKGELGNLAVSENGTYIAQKLMRLIKGNKDAIFVEVLPQFVNLCKDEKGLNVMKRMVTELNDVQTRLSVVEIVMQNGNLFIEDYYCNYAIQWIVQTWPAEITARIFRLISGKIMFYSLEKSSSNVVETMIKYSPPDIQKMYYDEISSIPSLHSTLFISNTHKSLWKLCNAKSTRNLIRRKQEKHNTSIRRLLVQNQRYETSIQMEENY